MKGRNWRNLKEPQLDNNTKIVLHSVNWIRVVDEAKMESGDEEDTQEEVRDGDGDGSDDGDGEDEMEFFRIYTCTNNPVVEHCVEYAGKSEHQKGKDYNRFPMYLRSAIDLLIRSYPLPMPVLEVAKKCSAEEELLTAKQLIEFIKVLHGMRLIKLSHK